MTVPRRLMTPFTCVGIRGTGALNDAITQGRLPEVSLVAEALHEAHISRIATDIVARVSEKIVTDLPLRGIDLAAAALALNMSSRQLQARLKGKGTTFEAVLSQVRRRLASRYLSDSDMPLTDIAFMLGFSELSSFTRAARQWFGMPPSQYREELRKGGGGGGTAPGAPV